MGGSQQDVLVFSSTRALSGMGHMLMNNPEGKAKACVYCLTNNIKSKAGWKVYTRHRCSLCNIALCTKNRPCFYLHHKKLLERSNLVLKK